MNLKVKTIQIKKSGEDICYKRNNHKLAVFAISDGVGSTLKAKQAARHVIKSVKKIRTYDKETIHQQLLSSFQANPSVYGFATLSLIVIQDHQTYGYIAGDGILIVDGKVVHYQPGNPTDYFPKSFEIYDIPNDFSSIMIASDGIAKYIDSKQELEVLANYIIKNPKKNNDFIRRVSSNPIDDITILIIERNDK